MVNYYKEEIELNWDKCPNCWKKGFDINLRKCLIDGCYYEKSHNTLYIEKVEKIIDSSKLEKNNNLFYEDPYDSKEKGFDDDSKYFK